MNGHCLLKWKDEILRNFVALRDVLVSILFHKYPPEINEELIVRLMGGMFVKLGNTLDYSRFLEQIKMILDRMGKKSVKSEAKM